MGPDKLKNVDKGLFPAFRSLIRNRNLVQYSSLFTCSVYARCLLETLQGSCQSRTVLRFFSAETSRHFTAFYTFRRPPFKLNIPDKAHGRAETTAAGRSEVELYLYTYPPHTSILPAGRGRFRSAPETSAGPVGVYCSTAVFV